MTSADQAQARLQYPGLFATRGEVARAQAAAARFAAVCEDPALALADERELRNRVALRSAVLWAVIGIPLLFVIAGVVLSVVAGGLLASRG